MPGRGVGRGSTASVEAVTRRGPGDRCRPSGSVTTRLVAVWERVVTSAHLEIEAVADAEPLEDARIAAAIAAVMHEAADRARTSVLVEVRADGTVRVHDDGGPPPRRLGVLASTARDALRDLGADLDEGPSDRLAGSVVRIVRPVGPPGR